MYDSYLISINNKDNDSDIIIGNKTLEDMKPLIIAGPCTISNREELIELAIKLKSMGVSVLRGGTYKSRTSPYSFQGLEEEGLKYLIEAKKITNLPIITEITDVKYLSKYINDIDIIQVGSRNMYNYELLKELGNTNKPILLKRGLSATYDEWINAAEYIMKNGNKRVILCERGIRTFESTTRNTLDLQVVPIMKKISYMPIIVDPSHSSGIRELVKPMAKAAIASGADGIMVEVEEKPDCAICDSKQTIDLETLKEIIEKVNLLKNI